MPREILLWEYLSGGGMATGSLPPSLLCEGIAMLRTIARDFAQAEYQLTIPLDARLEALRAALPPAKFLRIGSHSRVLEELRREVARIGHFFIIAPEFDDILWHFSRSLEEVGQNWGCSSDFIKIFADKARASKLFQKQGIPSPTTWALPLAGAGGVLEDLLSRNHQPLVVKPAQGAGAGGVFICTPEKLAHPAYVQQVTEKLHGKAYIAQELSHGIPGSVNIVAQGSDIYPLCVNDQLIELSSELTLESNYLGGVSPAEAIFKSATASSLQEQFTSILNRLPSPRSGFFGMDFICEPSGSLTVIEVNSRLTTSYVGLSRVISWNPISFLLGTRPPPLSSILEQMAGKVFYRKLNYTGRPPLAPSSGRLDFHLFPSDVHQETYACPPICDPAGEVACFLSLFGSSCAALRQQFRQVKHTFYHRQS